MMLDMVDVDIHQKNVHFFFLNKIGRLEEEKVEWKKGK